MNVLQGEKKRGRPQKYKNAAERQEHYRKRKQADGRRLDLYISNKACWRLDALAKAWGCSSSHVIDRLLLEADQRYGDILYSENEE